MTVGIGRVAGDARVGGAQLVVDLANLVRVGKLQRALKECIVDGDGGSGSDAIDLLLLGSVLLTSDAVLWTLDKNLQALAARFDILFG